MRSPTSTSTLDPPWCHCSEAAGPSRLWCAGEALGSPFLYEQTRFTDNSGFGKRDKGALSANFWIKIAYLELARSGRHATLR